MPTKFDVDGACPGARTAFGAPASHLFVCGDDELAGVPIQSPAGFALTIEGRINFDRYEGLQPLYTEYNIGPVQQELPPFQPD